MNFLQNIQSILAAGLGEAGGTRSGSSGVSSGGDAAGDLFSGLSDSTKGLLAPAALGGLVGALFTSSTARGIAGGALLAGAGAALWNKYKNRIVEESPQYRDAEATPLLPAGQGPLAPGSTEEERARRLVRALVFAAKSDGHIDEAEQKAIFAKLSELNVGPGGEALVRSALEEPLDPALIADGVKSADEALELYAVSCAVINIDHFMERGYLNALADALLIPQDVRKEMEQRT